MKTEACADPEFVAAQVHDAGHGECRQDQEEQVLNRIVCFECENERI